MVHIHHVAHISYPKTIFPWLFRQVNNPQAERSLVGQGSQFRSAVRKNAMACGAISERDYVTKLGRSWEDLAKYVLLDTYVRIWLYLDR